PILTGGHSIFTLQVLRMFHPLHTHIQEFANQMEHDSGILLDGLQVIPGADHLLRSLPMDKWSIFTSGKHGHAHPRIKHLKLPMPNTMGMDPKHCVVFEDAVAGVVAGRDSNAVVVGIRTLLSDKQLKDAGATYTVKDMTRFAVAVNPDGTLTVTIDKS
ncbi:DL-glycerol-3-phosphatase, partial [Coemansia furcata]